MSNWLLCATFLPSEPSAKPQAREGNSASVGCVITVQKGIEMVYEIAAFISGHYD